jgi:hypothetical protein
VVLLHELAHVRRLDCVTQPLAHLAVALHWFNPLAWLALRRLTAEREQACDDMVIAAGERASNYATHLLDVARTLRAGHVAAAAAVTMARRSELEARLRGILDAARPRRAATRWTLAAGILVTSVLVVPVASVRLARAEGNAVQTTGAPAAAGARAEQNAVYKPIDPARKPTSDVTGVVKDESGRPVGDVEVLAVRGREPDAERRTARADGQGRFRFDGLTPDGYWFFSVNEPRYGWEWDHERGVSVPAAAETLPVDVTLYRSRTLRGTVVDEGGKPAAGVRVALVNQVLPGTRRPVSGHIDIDFLVAETGADGRFTMPRLRPGRADFVLEHPEFANTFESVDIAVGADETTAALTIQRGLTLRGRVTHDGRPLAGVGVHVGMNEAHRPIVRWQGTTDDDGRFEAPRIRSLRPETRPRSASVSVSVVDPVWFSDGYGVYQTGDTEFPEVEIRRRGSRSRWASPCRRLARTSAPSARWP